MAQLTDQELTDKFATDPGFSLSFAANNNFPEMQKRFMELGFNTVNTPADAFQLLKIWTQRGAGDLLAYVFNIPYNNAAPNDTGGYKDFFASRNPYPKPSVGKVDPLLGALAFATGGLPGFAGFLLTGGASSGNSGKTPEQIAAEEAEKAEEAKKKKMLTWIIGGASGLALLLGLIIIISRPKK